MRHVDGDGLPGVDAAQGEFLADDHDDAGVAGDALHGDRHGGWPRWRTSTLPGSTPALLELLGPVSGMRVLDVACGQGRITRELARQGTDVTGSTCRKHDQQGCRD